MLYYDTNMGVLDAWRRAHRRFGGHVGAAFGIGADELALVAQAQVAELHRWSNLAAPLVRPRRSLLTTLHHEDRDAIYGFIADSRTRYSGPELHQTLQAFNGFILRQWHAAVRSGEQVDRYELDQEDCAAIAHGARHDFLDWANIPLALAVPRDGLIRPLANADESGLYALIGPWRKAS